MRIKGEYMESDNFNFFDIIKNMTDEDWAEIKKREEGLLRSNREAYEELKDFVFNI